jgi:hypothetical protein
MALIFKKLEASEPALNTGTNVTTVAAVVAMIAGIINHFYPHLISESVIATVITIAMFVLPLITGWLIRRKVWSPDSVQKAVKAASEGYNTLQQATLKEIKEFPMEDRHFG